MEFAAIFILPLLGGYLFALMWSYTSYSIRRADGHHLYFRAAFFGVVLFVAALVIRVLLKARWQSYAPFEDVAFRYIAPAMKDPTNTRQIEFVITALYSLMAGPILALLINALTPNSFSLRSGLSSFDWLLYTAQRNDMPVSVTLTTGKVYIGLVKRITDPERPPPSIKLLPMFSGYRQSDGRLKLTTNYRPIYKALISNPDDFKLPRDPAQVFEIAIRADLIATLNMFSPLAYSKFNPGQEESIGKPTEPEKQQLIVEILRKGSKAISNTELTEQAKSTNESATDVMPSEG